MSLICIDINVREFKVIEVLVEVFEDVVGGGGEKENANCREGGFYDLPSFDTERSGN
jgi:hypothetical protein